MDGQGETTVRAWIAEHAALEGVLRQAIDGDLTDLSASDLRDATACELGHALRAVAQELPEAVHASELHAAFHEAAAAALELARAGQQPAALAAVGSSGDVTLSRAGLARSLMELQQAAERRGRQLAPPRPTHEDVADDELHPTLGLLVEALAQEPSLLQAWGDPGQQVVTVLLPLASLERELLEGRDSELDRLRSTLQAVRYSPGGGRLQVQLSSLGHGPRAPLQARVTLA
jgi:hypothetical protein